MATEIELLQEIVRLMRRSPLEQIDDFVEYAARHGMAKVTHYQVPVNTFREWPALRANFMRIVFDCPAAIFRAQGGNIGQIEINGAAPIPFPDCPEETGGTVYDSTADVDSSIGQVAVFKMPIYSLKITNLFTAGAGNIIHVYLLDVGEYTQEAVSSLDTQDTYFKDLIDVNSAMASEISTIAGSTTDAASTLGSWSTISGSTGSGARTWPGT